MAIPIKSDRGILHNWLAFVGSLITTGVGVILNLNHYLEKFGWTLIIGGFLATVIIVLQLRKLKNTPIQTANEDVSESLFLKKLIKDVREHVRSDRYFENHFVDQDLFRVLRPYLSDESVNLIEVSGRSNIQRFVMYPSGGYSVATESLLNELARIEREWKIV